MPVVAEDGEGFRADPIIDGAGDPCKSAVSGVDPTDGTDVAPAGGESIAEELVDAGALVDEGGDGGICCCCCADP